MIKTNIWDSCIAFIESTWGLFKIKLRVIKYFKFDLSRHVYKRQKFKSFIWTIYTHKTFFTILNPMLQFSMFCNFLPWIFNKKVTLKDLQKSTKIMPSQILQELYLIIVRTHFLRVLLRSRIISYFVK